MLRIDERNWAVHKAEFWCTEVTFGTLQRVLDLRPNSNFSLSYDAILTFLRSVQIHIIAYNSHAIRDINLKIS